MGGKKGGFFLKACAFCKEKIIKENNCYVERNGKAYHNNCFIEYMTTIKNLRWRWTKEQCEKYIEEFISKIKSKNTRKALTDYIFEFYGITYLSKSFYIKLDSIYKGRYLHFKNAVSPEDLLDMWKRQANYLKSVNLVNINKGKIIKDENRVNYDLSILLSKYDSYCKWKLEKETENKRLEAQIADINKNTEAINQISKQRRPNKSNSIFDYLDEI